MVASPDIQSRDHLKPVKSQRNFPTARAIMALVLREMSTTYGRSPGGYVWAILEPVAGVAILTAIFSVGFRNPPIGTNFPLFYATGMVPFVAYMGVSAKVSQSINYSRQLLAYPSITYVDAVLARFLLNALTSVLVGYIIFSGILFIFGVRSALALDRIALAYAMAGALALGVGTMNSVLISMFPVWQQVWSILNRPLFIISGVFFLFDTIPQPYRDYLWYNPLIHVIGYMRSAFYGGYEANYVSPLYVFGLSLVLLVLGLVFLRRYHRDIISF